MATESKNKNNQVCGQDGGDGLPRRRARVPLLASVVNRSGVKIGKIRRGVWYDGLDNYKGVFVKENGEIRLRTDEVRIGYLDGNNNIFDNNGAYLASVRRFPWHIAAIAAVALAVTATLSALLASVSVRQTVDTLPAPVLFVCEADGTDWDETENLSVFGNGAFGDNTIAPGMSGTYSFTLDSRTDVPLCFSLTFSEENEYGIGLVYRLKRDGVYVAGEDGYVELQALSCKDLTIENNSRSLFELEWYWRDNDFADTAAGVNSATYVLHINFTAQAKTAQ